MVQQQEKNRNYTEIALEHLEIDMDERGTFARVSSEHNSDPYRVDIDESGKEAPHATNCSCRHRQFRGATCKHMSLINDWYQGLALQHKRMREEQPSYCSGCGHLCRGGICGYCAA